MRIGWLVAGWALGSAVRRLSRRTGATTAEASGSLPGDDVIAQPMVEWTRGVSVRATPERVWPWLVQMGYGRAGWYTPAYTGLKPAGQDEGPVIPVAEQALRTGSADELARILTEVVADQTKTRLDQAMALKQHEQDSVAAGRDYVEAMLGLQVWAHKLYQAATSGTLGAMDASARPRRGPAFGGIRCQPDCY